MTLRLYWFESFNPQKVRLALEELGLPYERVVVDLYKRENRAPAYLAINPRGKVPAIQQGDFVLHESHAILAWLGETAGRMWPASAHGRAQALQWLFYATGHLEDDIGKAWFNSWALPRLGREGDAEAVTRAIKALARPLGYLEGQLGQTPWILGEELSLVDCSLGVVVEALASSPFDFGPFPNISGWMARMRGREAWARAEIGYRTG